MADASPSMDIVNGTFELFSAMLVTLNVRRILADKRVEGISLIPPSFFALWGAWNLIYYPHLGQWFSFVGAVALASMNFLWLGLAVHYNRPSFGWSGQGVKSLIVGAIALAASFGFYALAPAIAATLIARVPSPSMDFINGAFELLSALLLTLNVQRILKDKRVEGISLIPPSFFALWGAWNLAYYPYLGQWFSFAGAVALAIMNFLWLGLAVRYRRNPGPDRHAAALATAEAQPA